MPTHSSSPLLRMAGVAKSFGATRALKGVALEVEAGQVLALIGENGAGKSTLMKILSGAVRPDEGQMELAGRPYAPAGPHDARRAGVAMIYQELSLAPDLSVEDNIMLGQEEQRLGLLRRSAQRRRVREALARLGHADLPVETPVGSLSVGMRQLVEIARALVMQARLIVFDEPTSSLPRQDVARLFGVIRRLRQEGLGIVYISHFLEEISELCDRYCVLRDGETAGGGDVAGASPEQIVSLMVGRDVRDLFPTVPHEPGEPILSLVSLTGGRSPLAPREEAFHLAERDDYLGSTGRRLPSDVSFDLRRGEILGISGLVGAGRTELLRAIFALDPVRSGTVRVAGHLRPNSPRGAIRAGLGLVSEDRKGEGLAQARSIADNLTYSRLAPYNLLGFLNLGRRRAAVHDWMQRLAVKARSGEDEVQSLSGGNQQKVALARVLHQQADVLLLDEPTRGIDVGTKAEIYRLMGEQAAAGKGIVFVSSYLPELLAVCDRVGVMSRGRLREIRPASEWTEETIMAAAVAGENCPESARVAGGGA